MIAPEAVVLNMASSEDSTMAAMRPRISPALVSAWERLRARPAVITETMTKPNSRSKSVCEMRMFESGGKIRKPNVRTESAVQTNAGTNPKKLALTITAARKMANGSECMTGHSIQTSTVMPTITNGER